MFIQIINVSNPLSRSKESKKTKICSNHVGYDGVVKILYKVQKNTFDEFYTSGYISFEQPEQYDIRQI